MYCEIHSSILGASVDGTVVFIVVRSFLSSVCIVGVLLAGHRTRQTQDAGQAAHRTFFFLIFTKFFAVRDFTRLTTKVVFGRRQREGIFAVRR